MKKNHGKKRNGQLRKILNRLIMLLVLLTVRKITTYYNKEKYTTNTLFCFSFFHKCFSGSRASLLSLTFAKAPPKKKPNNPNICEVFVFVELETFRERRENEGIIHPLTKKYYTHLPSIFCFISHSCRFSSYCVTNKTCH